MALAGALLAPAVSHAQNSCTREGLQTAADLYIAGQAHGSGSPQAGGIGDERHVENFDTTPGRKLDQQAVEDRPPSQSAGHCALRGHTREGLVSDKADPYALGTRLQLRGQERGGCRNRK